MEPLCTSSGRGSDSTSASTGSQCCSSAASSRSASATAPPNSKFSTDQSNYLNKSDQVYKDNVAYQKLFGGEAMVTLVTMDPGHTVAELFTADGHQAVDRRRRARSTRRTKCSSVVTPLTALQWNDNLVQGPNGDVDAERRRQDPRRRPRPREVEGRASRAQRVGAGDDRAHQRDSRRAAHASTTRSTSTSCSTTIRSRTIRSRSARRSSRSSPTLATRRWSCGCSATSRSRTRATPPTS